MPEELKDRLSIIENTLTRIDTSTTIHNDYIRQHIDEQKSLNKKLSEITSRNANRLDSLESSDDRRSMWFRIMAVPIVGILAERIYHLITHT